LRPSLKAVPAVIIWQIWRRRNIVRYGGSMSKQAMILGINRHLCLFAKIRYLWFSDIPYSWPMIVKFLEEYFPLNYSKVVVWNYLALGSFKCNKYGCSKGNAGRGALAFCVRNAPTNFVYAE